jgi:hypothetical protein
VALATLPRDRWGALGLVPRQAEGTAWSTPVRLPPTGFKLTLNAEGASSIQVEIADERFSLPPDFSGGLSGSTTATAGLDCPVAWKKDTRALAGRTVRFRFKLLRSTDSVEPRLYAVGLTPDPGATAPRASRPALFQRPHRNA